MKKGLVDIQELRNNKYNCDCRGSSAYCFIKGNKIIKVYATKDDFGYMALDLGKLCDFSKYKADTIIFPNEYIYENGVRVGEILDYISDKSIIHSFNEDTNINLMINYYESVLLDLYTYSNIKMIDLCSANILYSNENGFHIIDTSLWEIGQNQTRNNIYSFNGALIRKIFEFIDLPVNYRKTYAFLDKSIIHSCNKYGTFGKDLITLLEMNINNNYRLVDMIYLFKRLYEMHYSEELKTLNDMQNYTKVLKKG